MHAIRCAGAERVAGDVETGPGRTAIGRESASAQTLSDPANRSCNSKPIQQTTAVRAFGGEPYCILVADLAKGHDFWARWALPGVAAARGLAVGGSRLTPKPGLPRTAVEEPGPACDLGTRRGASSATAGTSAGPAAIGPQKGPIPSSFAAFGWAIFSFTARVRPEPDERLPAANLTHPHRPGLLPSPTLAACPEDAGVPYGTPGSPELSRRTGCGTGPKATVDRVFPGAARGPLVRPPWYGDASVARSSLAGPSDGHLQDARVRRERLPVLLERLAVPGAPGLLLGRPRRGPPRAPPPAPRDRLVRRRGRSPRAPGPRQAQTLRRPPRGPPPRDGDPPRATPARRHPAPAGAVYHRRCTRSTIACSGASPPAASRRVASRVRSSASPRR